MLDRWFYGPPVMLLPRQLEFGGTQAQLTLVGSGLDRAKFEGHVGCLHPEGAACIPAVSLDT
jgi:hypothetical protein